MHQQFNVDWSISPEAPGSAAYKVDMAALAVLMDIRSELRRIRAIAECPNASAIPDIRKNTSKKKRKVKK